MTTKEKELPALKDVGFTKDVIFVDLETSGFNTTIPKAVTLSIGALLMNTDGEIVSEFYGVICPTDEQIENMSPGATAVNGLTEEILRAEGNPAEEVWSAFATWLKDNKVTATKTRYVGQNPGFDIDFITAEQPALAKRYGWKKDRALDIIELYMTAESKFIVEEVGKGKRGKNGRALALALGVDPEDEVHNALEGARVNYRNFTRLMQKIKKWKDDGERL